jgi:hypothetical protein
MWRVKSKTNRHFIWREKPYRLDQYADDMINGIKKKGV